MLGLLLAEKRGDDKYGSRAKKINSSKGPGSRNEQTE